MKYPLDFYDKKISLYGKKLKMMPTIKMFGPDKKKGLKPEIKFWPEPEEPTDDELPESE